LVVETSWKVIIVESRWGVPSEYNVPDNLANSTLSAKMTPLVFNYFGLSAGKHLISVKKMH